MTKVSLVNLSTVNNPSYAEITVIRRSCRHSCEGGNPEVEANYLDSGPRGNHEANRGIVKSILWLIGDYFLSHFTHFFGKTSYITQFNY